MRSRVTLEPPPKLAIVNHCQEILGALKANYEACFSRESGILGIGRKKEKKEDTMLYKDDYEMTAQEKKRHDLLVRRCEKAIEQETLIENKKEVLLQTTREKARTLYGLP